ncbi:MAG TPA: hypothetical protein VG797_10520 [Phycisphaerales bacterium]|nr:hypothetical protein [Phycisphaerales bacterium]
MSDMGVLREAKHVMAAHFPGAHVAAMWEMRRRLFPSARQRLEAEIFAKLGNPSTILDGPFTGMRYHRIVYAGSTLARTLAVYEKEIHSAVERLISWGPDVVVDIGTSDGYYLVGLARRLPTIKAVGYDMLSLCRYLTRRVIQMNGVQDRVQVRGKCEPADLERVLSSGQRPAVFSDCDGGEDHLLRPDIVPSLRRAMILVELHDVYIPGISEEIRRRFEPTHTVELIPVRIHQASDVPSRFGLTETEAAAVDGWQRRMDNFWYLMTPRT